MGTYYTDKSKTLTDHQVAGLRDIMTKRAALNPSIIAIGGAKGGVGKTSVAVNLALSLGKTGKRVLLWDAAFGLGNTDLLLGVTSEYTIQHAIERSLPLSKVALSLNKNVDLIAAGSGSFNMANLSTLVIESLFFDLEEVANNYDFVIVDTGAGIGERVINTLLLSEEVIVVTTPDPTSITDCYATIKLMHNRLSSKKIRLLVNQVSGPTQGEEVFSGVNRVCEKYLGKSIEYAGYIPTDLKLTESIRSQKALVELYPGAKASINFSRLAAKLSGDKDSGKRNSGVMQWIRSVVTDNMPGKDGHLAVT